MPAGPRLKDFWMPQLVGYPMETAIAVARLTFGRVLERYPFHLCLAHGGGCVPSLRGRMDMGWNRKDVAHTTAVPPSEFTDRLYYDTAVFNSTMLARIVQDVGADHVMLGTDHPFELGDFTPRQTVADLGLDDADSRAILWDNAAKLLGLQVPVND
jgi:aminocarboxymuconate-semialdehyde decarboxylase